MNVNKDLELEESEKEGIVVINIKGRVDTITTPVLERKLAQTIRNGKLKIMLVMTHVTYISSIGLRLIGEVANTLSREGGKLVVCSPSKNVENVFRMTSFDLLLDVTPSMEKAFLKFS